MPVMDGFDVIEILKHSPVWETIPIIVNTAKELDENDYERLTGCVTKILFKSQYTKQDLFNEINQALSKLTFV
jgi:adenylate cyclase